MPLAPATSLGTPIYTTRQWTYATATRSGGHMAIQHGFFYDNDVPTEWALTKLETGEVTIQEGPNRIYSQNTPRRASNGRVYFHQRSTPGALTEKTVNCAYYDPDDEAMHFLEITDPTVGARHQACYSFEFNHSGDTLYCGTISSGGFRPMVFKIDPLTAQTTVLGSVGTATALPKYAYYLAADGGAEEWLYVAVGQDFWEIVAINLNTLEQTTLLTTSGPGNQHVEFEVRSKGFTANTISNGVQTRYWIADGVLTPFVSNSIGPPGGDRTVTRYTNAVPTPPEVDFDGGIGRIAWRPYGSSGDWTTINYEVTYRSAADVESLCALADGTILGNGEQYSGFFRYYPSTGETTWFGEWVGGVSQPVILSVDATTVYFAGYPNAALYQYNPTQTWIADTNPVQLGSYGDGCRYPLKLINTGGRIYTCGRRANDAVGHGVAYYTIATDTFSTPVTNDDFTPRGFVHLPTPGLFVFSGEVEDTSSEPEAVLITFDAELVEQDRWTVTGGLQNTGILFNAPEPNCVIGLTTDAPVLLYKFDVVAGGMIASAHLGSVTVNATATDDNGDIWAVLDSDLWRIDPLTLRRELHRTGII
jgi:hypothetical protein